MKNRKIVLVTVVTTVIVMTGSAALADWDPGDSFKMHYPQTPLSGGMDVEFVASTLADDWQCTQSGPVSDIHFWISWMDDLVQPIPFVNVHIFSDVPDPDGTGPAYSMPGQELWQRTFQGGAFTVRDMPLDVQDWFDPSQPWPLNFGENDHTRWQQINITNILEPLVQQAGQIYWLAIDFGTLPFIGWKESGALHFNDDAVWWNAQLEQWIELRHPDPAQNYSIDLAFVITPEPATVMLLLAGGLFLRKRS